MELNQLKSLLTLAHKAGKVYFGLDTLKILSKKNYRGFAIVAEDISNRSLKELLFLATKGYNIYKLKGVDKKTLGSWFGKRTVGVIFLPNTKLTFKIENLLLKEGSEATPLDGGRYRKSKEVKQLETQRICGTTGNRLQKIKKNTEGRFRFKRSGKHKGNGRT